MSHTDPINTKDLASKIATCTIQSQVQKQPSFTPQEQKQVDFVIRRLLANFNDKKLKVGNDIAVCSVHYEIKSASGEPVLGGSIPCPCVGSSVSKAVFKTLMEAFQHGSGWYPVFGECAAGWGTSSFELMKLRRL